MLYNRFRFNSTISSFSLKTAVIASLYTWPCIIAMASLATELPKLGPESPARNVEQLKKGMSVARSFSCFKAELEKKTDVVSSRNVGGWKMHLHIRRACFIDDFNRANWNILSWHDSLRSLQRCCAIRRRWERHHWKLLRNQRRRRGEDRQKLGSKVTCGCIIIAWRVINIHVQRNSP